MSIIKLISISQYILVVYYTSVECYMRSGETVEQEGRDAINAVLISHAKSGLQISQP